MRDEKDNPKKTKEEELLETARKRFQIAVEAEQEIRKEALDDLKFSAGNQWPEDIKRERFEDGRPCLVINRVLQHVRQITNDQRQNRASIKVHPVDDRADVETAKIYNGMIRHIEYNSGADVAYDTAFEGAARKGFGYWRVITNYVHPESFDQEILIKQIEDDFCVYLDPFHKEPDGSDANWGFIFEKVSREDYEIEYGDSDLAMMQDWTSVGDDVTDWVSKDGVRIAEYFYKEYEEKEIALLNTGRSVRVEDIEELFPEGLPEGISIDKTRKTKCPVIKWAKINGHEVLEQTVWPGLWIPIIPCIGGKLVIEGKKILEGVVRHAKDSQRMYNYWASTETETIALAPRSPFIVAEGQIPKAYEYQWQTANKKSHAYLMYKPTTIAGQLAPPPQRNVFEPAIQGITSARFQAAEDLKSSTGIYDAAMGNQSNETSGVAIQRRSHQAQTANFHLIDNLYRSIRHSGRIIVDLIPKIYDTARAARIIGEEGEQEVVRINEEFEKGGEKVKYDLGKGKYDVIIDTGPSFATKREEAAQTMLELARSAPQLMEVAPDLVVKNFDFMGATEIAERLKRIIPPGIADSDGAKAIPPEIQAQMEQMGQMIEQLTTQLNEKNDEIKTKKLELEFKERIEMLKAENDLLIQKMKLSDSAAQFQVRTQLEVDKQLRELDIAQKNKMMNGQGPMNPAAPQQPFNQQPTGGQSPGNI